MSSFVLYVFMYSVQSIAILPIEDNPFPTMKACKTIARIINEDKIITVGPYTFKVGSAVCQEELV